MDEIKECRKITAKEAREECDNTPIFLKRIYKMIKEEAREGKEFIYWEKHGISPVLVKKAIAELKNEGYGVGEQKTFLVISW